VQAEESELPAPPEDAVGKVPGRFPFVDEWANLGADETPDRGSQRLVLRAEDRVTGAFWSRFPGARITRPISGAGDLQCRP